MIMSLGLKSATVYLPFYNLIKEVSWSCSVTSSSKESINAKLTKKNGKV